MYYVALLVILRLGPQRTPAAYASGFLWTLSGRYLPLASRPPLRGSCTPPLPQLAPPLSQPDHFSPAQSVHGIGRCARQRCWLSRSCSSRGSRCDPWQIFFGKVHASKMSASRPCSGLRLTTPDNQMRTSLASSRLHLVPSVTHKRVALVAVQVENASARNRRRHISHGKAHISYALPGAATQSSGCYAPLMLLRRTKRNGSTDA